MRIKFLKLISIAIVVNLVSCATSMESGTKATLRPDLTENNVEIWQIFSSGDGSTNTEYNAIVRAAYTSRKEGQDCFIVFDSKTNVETYSYNVTTMKEQESTTSYNSAYYGYYGNSTTTSKVPVTTTHYKKKKFTDMYIVPAKLNFCNEQKNTKWRNNIYYNDAIINDYVKKHYKDNNWEPK